MLISINYFTTCKNYIYICIMETIKQGLMTISNYARDKNISRPTVYKMIDNKELSTVIIDNITFIKLK